MSASVDVLQRGRECFQEAMRFLDPKQQTALWDLASGLDCLAEAMQLEIQERAQRDAQIAAILRALRDEVEKR
jgi:hypothetical protein